MSAPVAAGNVHAGQRAEARVTMLKLVMIVPVMLVFCASLVPLYRTICDALGLSATRAIVQNTQVDASRFVKVEFDANVGGNGGWRFAPLEKSVSIHPGALVTVNYRVTNTLAHAATGRAVYSLGPAEAAGYFKKVACFCFNNQVLAAGETRDMAVSFQVDPAMPKDIGSIALSYTFMTVPDKNS